MELQFDDFEVKVHGKRGFTLKPAGDGDAGYDLYAPENVYLPYGCRRMIDTGVIIETPEPLFCLVVPRSSTGTSRAHGVRIANTVGIIDPSYRGQDDTIGVCLEREERKKEFVGTFPLSSGSYLPAGRITGEEQVVKHCGKDLVDVFGFPETTDSALLFEEGDRFAQIVFVPFSRPDLIKTSLDQFSSEDRGGFGSTGA